MPELIDVAPGSPEWLAARRAGVTATDIVAVTGLSSTESAYSLYHRKLGNLPDQPDSDRWRLGRELEPYIASRWLEAHPGQFLTGHAVLCRSSERPWQMATLDREMLVYEVEPDTNGTNVIGAEPLELKSWADADRDRWDDGPPPAVRAQVLWQMDVMGVAAGHVGVLFLPSGEFRSFTIEHDGTQFDAELYTHGDFDELQACTACKLIDTMRTAGEEFMIRMLNNDPPSPDGSAATLAALKARYAEPRNDKVAVIESADWQLYDNDCQGVAHWKANKAKSEARLRELIGEAGAIEVDGEIVARRVISTVKAHYRKEGTRDVITRLKRKDNDDE